MPKEETIIFLEMLGMSMVISGGIGLFYLAYSNHFTDAMRGMLALNLAGIVILIVKCYRIYKNHAAINTGTYIPLYKDHEVDN